MRSFYASVLKEERVVLRKEQCFMSQSAERERRGVGDGLLMSSEYSGNWLAFEVVPNQCSIRCSVNVRYDMQADNTLTEFSCYFLRISRGANREGSIMQDCISLSYLTGSHLAGKTTSLKLLYLMIC